jgi:fibronectin-binding autotransporter adhesin
LSWNGSAGADSYIVKRSTTSGSGYTNIATGVTATSLTDTGLVNGTTYYYVVAATNVYGASPDSAEASATPGLVANLIVNTVGTLNGNGQTFLEATGNSLNEATLAANIATAFANNAGGVWNFDGTYFNVTNGQTIALTYGTSQANSLILTLAEGAGANGINQASVAAEATSGSFELGLAGNGATRTFTPNKPLLTVAIFNTDRNDATRIPVLTVTYQDNTTASTSGANANNVYFHCLSGTESNPIVSFAISQNNLIRYDDLAFIVAKPPAPQNLTATPGDANVALAWSAASNATAYYIKRSTTSGAGYINIATNSSLAFTNTGLANGTLYYFVVSAVGAAGEGANSVEVGARPTSFAPTQLGFVATGNQLELNWPADHTGWQLQVQTNNLGAGLGTNWSNVASSTLTNQLKMHVGMTDGSVFFRLVRPY